MALHFLAILVQLRGLLCDGGDGHANGYCHPWKKAGYKVSSTKRGPWLFALHSGLCIYIYIVYIHTQLFGDYDTAF